MKVFRAASVALLLALCGCQAAATSAPPGSPASPVASPTRSPAGGSAAPVPVGGSPLLGAAVANAMAAGSVATEFRAMVMGQPVSGKIAVDASGHCAGSFESPKLGPVEFLTDGTRAWMKAGERFWGPEHTARIGGRYVTGPQSGDFFRTLTVFCSQAATMLSGGPGFKEEVTEQGRQQAGGVTTVTLVDRDGARADVSDNATPYVTRLRSGSNEEPYDWTYRDYGKPVAFTPPPADTTVDVTTVVPPRDGQGGS